MELCKLEYAKKSYTSQMRQPVVSGIHWLHFPMPLFPICKAEIPPCLRIVGALDDFGALCAQDSCKTLETNQFWGMLLCPEQGKRQKVNTKGKTLKSHSADSKNLCLPFTSALLFIQRSYQKYNRR